MLLSCVFPLSFSTGGILDYVTAQMLFFFFPFYSCPSFLRGLNALKTVQCTLGFCVLCLTVYHERWPSNASGVGAEILSGKRIHVHVYIYFFDQ